MSGDTTRKPLRRTIRGGRPFFFEDTAIDKVLNMVVTLGSEVWALRERLAAVEALQVGRGHLGADEVDGYEFTPEQEARLAGDRKEFIDNLFRILQEQVENVAAKSSGVRDAASGRPVVFGARGAKAKKQTTAKSGARVRPAAKPVRKRKSAAVRARSSARR